MPSVLRPPRVCFLLPQFPKATAKWRLQRQKCILYSFRSCKYEISFTERKIKSPSESFRKTLSPACSILWWVPHPLASDCMMPISAFEVKVPPVLSVLSPCLPPFRTRGHLAHQIGRMIPCLKIFPFFLPFFFFTFFLICCCYPRQSSYVSLS